MRRSSFRTQSVALGILVVASVVGNVSMSAARTNGRTIDRLEATATPATPTIALAGAHVATSPPGDEARVVPAIYSWDPDVTFIFYRHVTKWM